MKKWILGLIVVSTGCVLAGCQQKQTTTQTTTMSTSTTSTTTEKSIALEEISFDSSDSSTSQTSKSSTTEATLDTNSRDANIQKMSEESTSSSSTSATVSGKWNAQKAQELATFMTSWGTTMQQTYQAYTPGNNVDFYGSQLPDQALKNGNGGWTVALNKSPITLKWSENGTAANGEYAVVATYSDANTQPEFKKHFYFFTIKDGQPYVLITMQNQGNAENYLYVSETENTDLRNGFANIVN
ncbi:DUF4767 domain-containing protein [uncultured Enterococcus sp.]|uniref:DUF4767 domain-containing protein n=1 Tax=uncultured Enterococcus sp. TaxID=167972 RepID=UPI0025D99C20|nr:DUF4767 domain-containing protein [uncultured Enterococcus sp.]